MPVLSLRNACFRISDRVLLDNVTLQINSGERIGLLGRNGAGKSTLMRIMSGELVPDEGIAQIENSVRSSRLIQEVPEGADRPVIDIIQNGLSHVHKPGTASDRVLDDQWKNERDLHNELTRFGLDGMATFSSLSSGMKRRVLLAQTLFQKPDLLLLDEPTNHLDIMAIAELEQFLLEYRGTLVFVTHDRIFLQTLATRIIEIDRGRLFDWTCNYHTFLNRKQLMLQEEEKHRQSFDKKLSQEEQWIRQGIKARRTRNEGRVRALEQMRLERRTRRERPGQATFQSSTAPRSGQLVMETREASFSYGDVPVIKDLSLRILRGDKIGIIGSNGAGKSTLLKLLLKDIEPLKGDVRHGTDLQVVYYDQQREVLNEEMTVAEIVGEGQELLQINGKQRHLFSYLQDFLFNPEQAKQKAASLSGGERNRLLLARLLKHPSNLLVLDEPTNDLDAETLELLEEFVVQYTGTLLLVSHDRAFLNNIVTSTLVFEDKGVIKEYIGGYDDYLRQVSSKTKPESPKTEPPSVKSTKQWRNRKQPKLSYHEQRELERIPDMISQMEEDLEILHEQVSSPSFLKGERSTILAANQAIEDLQTSLKQQYTRWEELEAEQSE